MANKSNLNLTSLDFDSIKQSLKDYLKGQDQFKDYDFEGSSLSILLDVLSYNTHLNALYANMVANETFLDSANTQSSVISIAKHLGYVPKSYKSAVAYVDIEFLDSNKFTQIENGTVYISKGDRFTTNAENKTFMFVATDTTQVKKDGNKYTAKNVELKEGINKTISYVYSQDQNIAQKFIIPEINVDTDSIEVRIAQSSDNTTGIEDIWQKVNDINKLTDISKVYFLQQNADLLYEIYFGDGILGKNPEVGNVIIISYRITNGDLANGIGKNETDTLLTFSYSEDSKTKTTLVKDSDSLPTPSFGGSILESTSSIKYYAPRNYQAQERAVTAEDYRTLLARQYGEQAESVYVWGGEDNDPPIYGKVFVSIKPVGATKLTQLEKLAIAENILKERNIVSILPEVIDPDYIYVILTVNIKYDTARTTLTKETLGSDIKTSITNYANSSIGRFDQNFYYSQFSTFLDKTFNPPIISNNITLQLQKRLQPLLGSQASYNINFDNSLYHPISNYSPIISSTGFGYQDSTSLEDIAPNVDAYLDDDGNGILRIYKLVDAQKVILNSNIGTVDYTTGKLNLVNFNPQYLVNKTDTEIKITCIPNEKDILARRNQIILINSENITINTFPQTLRYDPYSSSASTFKNTNSQ